MEYLVWDSGGESYRDGNAVLPLFQNLRMSELDWLVLGGTLLFIVVYGVWKTRGSTNIEGYLLGDNSMKWGTIGLSVMATQASAITFLSTPGQAYESGMGFVQNYFGLPLAIIIIAAVFIPIYYRLKVFTAYEYLEKRFDYKTRLLGAGLFLIQRGLAAGITIYAPSIILATALGWQLSYTILVVGILVIVYTVSGGTKAVSLTQKYQMGIIMLGMFAAFFLILYNLPQEVGFSNALHLAGIMGKTEAVDFSFDFSKRYTFWSGITGGLFLALSYFGTDQSQVARYLSGKSVAESRMGLIFNALLKIPMQFFILLVGVMVFVFYQFVQPPVFFKQQELETAKSTQYQSEIEDFEARHAVQFTQKKEAILEWMQAPPSEKNLGMETLKQHHQASDALRADLKAFLKEKDLVAEVKDSDYVFITFIMNYLPQGIIGLLLAVILSAAMSSTSSELNALASTTVVDFYKRWFQKEGSESHYLWISKLLTAGWGAIAISFAFMAQLAENLIEMVNIIGSIFYGTILGIFLVAFFMKKVRGNAVFVAAIIAEAAVITLYLMGVYGWFELGYLWFNAIGCALVMGLALLFESLSGLSSQARLDP
jgi:solute:Na+ symporter, SSS family